MPSNPNPHPFSPGVKRCPYPYYDRWREESPVLWNDAMRAWIVTGFAEASQVLTDHETFSSANSVTGAGIPDDDFPSLITADEFAHRRLRTLVARAFAPANIEAQWGRRIQSIVAELLDAVEGNTIRLVRDLCYPLPVRMIAEVIGVESDRYAQFKAWADVIVDGSGGDLADSAAANAAEELTAYLAGEIEDRRAHPRNDLITRLVQEEEAGERLSEPELHSFLFLLLVAGTQGTTMLIATAIRMLAERPALRKSVETDRSLIPNLIEEALRYESPVAGFYRRATRDVVIAGQQVRPGEVLCVLYGAANRDSREFDEPDRFDAARGRRDHLAFGTGIHYCLGANLARIEAGVAVNAVLDRYDHIEREPGFRIQWRSTPFYRSLVEYTVAVRAR